MVVMTVDSDQEEDVAVVADSNGGDDVRFRFGEGRWRSGCTIWTEVAMVVFLG